MPLTVRRSVEVVGLLAVGYIFIKGRDIIMPFILAGFLALMLMPIYRKLTGFGIPKTVAILVSVITLILIVSGITVLLSFQVAGLLNDVPQMQKNLNAHWNSISHWIADQWNIPIRKQLDVINKQLNGLTNNIIGLLQGAAVSLSGVFVFIGLVPIYIFLIMSYKEQLSEFVFLWFKKDSHHKVDQSFHETQVIVKYYLGGLLIQITYLTILLGGALFLFGIKHALLIGLVFAILNLVPYIGALIGNIIGVLVTLTSSQQLWQVWVVLGTIAVVQFLDNNILMPRIVGSKVKINALASIAGIIIGGAMAGVAGMFLSIPIMAVLKIVFDKSESLCQWGVLLGEPDAAKNKNDNSQGVVDKIKNTLAEQRDDELNDKRSTES